MKRISTKGMPREEWLKLRKHSIGGSDAAAIVGLSKWSSPFSVWADKTNRLPDKDDTEAMRQGRDLEQYVADRWMDATGKKCQRLQAMLYNDKYPWAHADIDRAVVGEKAGLECKTTTTLDIGQFENTDFPVKYYGQCVHYLAVTGWDRWYLSVVVLGRGHYTYVLERNQDEIDALMAAEEEFWSYVSNDTPPPVDGSEATTDAIKAVFKYSDDSDAIDLFGRETALDHLAALKDQKKEIEAEIAEIENVIKGDMRDAPKAFCGKHKVTWATQKKTTFDRKALAADHPELDLSKYFKESSSRPFKVTEMEE